MSPYCKTIVGTLALVAVAGIGAYLWAPIPVCQAADAPAAQETPVKKTGSAATAEHTEKVPHTDDTNRGASIRENDDPTKGRSTGDAKLSGPGSGEGL